MHPVLGPGYRGANATNQAHGGDDGSFSVAASTPTVLFNTLPHPSVDRS